MPADLFAFPEKPESACPAGAYIARLPAGLRNRKSLFAVLQQELRLPPYFGANWDALEECFRDLHWIPQPTVCLLHQELPALPAGGLRTYLAILRDAVAHWRGAAAHKLIVVFPPGARAQIESILAQPPGDDS
jgi:hypothetical protein